MRFESALSARIHFSEINHLESVELAQPVLQQDQKQLLEKWLKENRVGSISSLWI